MRSVSSLRASTPALILLVDDNRDGVMARRSVLEELGYRVVTAGCGSDALQSIEESVFDLCDYRLPHVADRWARAHRQAAKKRIP